MSHDMLAIIWFGLWGLLWAVYFVLDGYALGTGMLFPFLTKNKLERNQLQEAIGPFWGGNEVWLITAGGATFAAFPLTYANMFSFLYTPLMLILFALFFRAAGLEFMHKDDSEKWQTMWKWAFFVASGLIALLFGVAFANLFDGLLIGEGGYEGTLLSLLHPYGLLGGILFVVMFLLSGSLWVQLKTIGEVAERAMKLTKSFAMITAAVVAIFLVATANRTPIFENYTAIPVLWIVPALAMVASLGVIWFVLKERIGLAFTAVCVTIFSLMATGFIGMFPNMLPSKIDPAFSTNLFDAAGSQLNLTIMLIVALICVPIVIGYQLWSYRVFKEKILKETAKGYQ
ncbi:cytochrome d ubiquinol oxidase subunit II [Calidifontibacillus oryziterrae]|uniref:cytochrome d ubiquinol oxidase subunit II n=1 Tax=Calidifontibacillus oryziterrae TaxID=1191699 RepID=UPI0002E6D814|nr:cytochrome d ubiquinol oxidase subunit II [Calidifontibacillus oryziterrae]